MAPGVEPTSHELHIRLAPLSSQHRTRVLEALCADLNQTNSIFPVPNYECVIRWQARPETEKADRFPLYYVGRSEFII